MLFKEGATGDMAGALWMLGSERESSGNSSSHSYC